MRSALVIVGLLAAVGCSDSTETSDAPGSRDSCLPAMPIAQPTVVNAGTDVAVSSAGLDDCTTEPTEYRIVLGTIGRHDPVDLGVVDVAADGTFETSVAIPEFISPGQAYLSIRGSAFDDCDVQASCASYGVIIEVGAPVP